MKASDITRITVQIHYPKFGEEMEENIQRLAGQERAAGLAARSSSIATRRATPTAWSSTTRPRGSWRCRGAPRSATTTSTPAIPKDLLEQPEVKDIAKAAAQDAASSAKEKVLDEVRELLGGNQRNEDHHRSITFWRRAALVGVASTNVAPAQAQQILLDKPVRAGELTCFPDLERSQRLLLRVRQAATSRRTRTASRSSPSCATCENVRSGADQAEAREGEGGGIVHALVCAERHAGADRATARRELQRLKPGAQLVGPVVFKSGKFGLVSSFKDTERQSDQAGAWVWATRRCSTARRRRSRSSSPSSGPKILWESFKTPTPDISFTFEMDMSGYRSPQRALIEANFDQIYEHKAFGGGRRLDLSVGARSRAPSTICGASGAIKLTQVGERREAGGADHDRLQQDRRDHVRAAGRHRHTRPREPARVRRRQPEPARPRHGHAGRRTAQEARTENERIRTENRATRAENADGGGSTAR